GKSLQYHQVWIALHFGGAAVGIAEIDISLIYDDNDRKSLNQPADSIALRDIARRVVGQVEQQDRGIFCHSIQDLLGARLKFLFRQQYFIHLNIVDIGGDCVHAVGWGRDQHTILAWSAKDAV